MDAPTSLFARYRQHGDLDALGRVFDALSPRLLALALHLTGNAADAEDALQAAFVVAMNKATAFDPQQPVGPWLAGILAGEARNLRRREHRRRSEPLSEPLLVDGAAGDDAERRDLVQQLRTQIDVLPVEQRQVLLLQLQHGLQPADIAEVLGVPPGTVRMRIHRGLLALRRTLPAGLALATLVGLPQRGIAAVRTAVMKTGAAQAVTTTAATLTVATIGGLAMKKVILGAVAVVAAWLVWWLAATAPGATPPLPDGARPAALAAQVGDASTKGAGAEAGSDQPAVGVARAATAALGALAVVVRGDQSVRVSRSVQEATSHEGSGVPLAGVSVEAWPGDLDQGAPDGRRLIGTTDVQGAVRFADLEPGSWRLVAFAGQGRLLPSRGVVVAAGDATAVELHVALAATVRGWVVDVGGTAVAGAAVWVGSRLDVFGFPRHSLRLAARSAADGSFAVPCAAREDYICARKPGYGASWSHPIQQLGDGDVTLSLGREAGSVSAEVVDDTGRPMADIAVALEPDGESLHRATDGTLLGPRLAAIGHSDARGRLVVDGLAPGSYRARICHMPWAPIERPLIVADGERTAVQLVMQRRASVFGYLTSTAGEPKAGVYVWLEYADGSSSTVVSSRDGSYRFEGVDLAPFKLSAGRLGAGAQAERKCPAPVLREQRVDLVIEEGEALRGRAQTQSGRGLAAWYVTVDVAGKPDSKRTDLLDEAGRFTIWGLDAVPHRLRLHRAPGRADEAALTVMATPGETVDLVVGDDVWPALSIRGRVVDAAGQPLPSAEVYLLEQPPLAVDPVVDAAGKFVIGDVSPGDYQIACTAAGYVSWRRPVRLGAAGRSDAADLDLGDIVLTPAATLRVRFQRPDGRPWQGRPPVPWLAYGDGQVLHARSDVHYELDGDEVVVTGIRPGHYQVHGPLGDELLIEPVEVDLGSGAVVRLVMSAAIGRHRTLVFAAESGDQALDVTVRRGDGVVVEQRTVEVQGESFEVQMLLPLGDLVVSAQSPAGVRYERAITVGAEVGGAGRIDVPRTP